MAPPQIITGTALRPGISRNRRRYSREAIGRAVARMQERLDSGSVPVTMATSHGSQAAGDVTAIAAHVRRVWQDDDGALRFEAALADTRAGRDVKALVAAGALRNVSIFGSWRGRVRTENGVETADDLEIAAIDFVAHPGVDGAVIDPPKRAAEMAAAGFFGESLEGHFVDSPYAYFTTEQVASLRAVGFTAKRIAEVDQRLAERHAANAPAVLAEMTDDELWKLYANGAGGRPGTTAAQATALEAALAGRPDLVEELARMVAGSRLAEAAAHNATVRERELAEMSDDELWGAYADVARRMS